MKKKDIQEMNIFMINFEFKTVKYFIYIYELYLYWLKNNNLILFSN